MSKVLEPIIAILFTGGLSTYEGLSLFFLLFILILLIIRRD